MSTSEQNIENSERAGEQISSDVQTTNEAEKTEQPTAFNEKKELTGDLPKITTMTLRVREHTRPFFEKVSECASMRNLSINDAATEIIRELSEAQASTLVHASALAALHKEVESLKDENTRLKAELASINEHKPESEPHTHSVQLNEKLERLFTIISHNRYRNIHVRERYRLKSPETIGQLLVNCISTEEILMDHNNCFFTGFTREQFKAYKEGR